MDETWTPARHADERHQEPMRGGVLRRAGSAHESWTDRPRSEQVRFVIRPTARVVLPGVRHG